MISVTTGTRLHFGLFHVPSEASTNTRRYGGLGLMIEQPRIHIRLQKSTTWSATGPSAERALAFAKAAITDPQQAFEIEVLECPTEHTGLGVGTQLGMAIAAAVQRAYGVVDVCPIKLAASVMRGERSAIGVHGFAQGGFLVDAGKLPNEPLGTIIARFDFPHDWPIVLLQPFISSHWHGKQEQQAFEQSLGSPEDNVATMTRRALLGIVPALVERNYPLFAEELFEFNRLAGMPFRAAQGGIYAHAELERLVNFVREVGVPAVGQSSWGSTLFVICSSETQATELIAEIAQREPTCRTILTHGANIGAVLDERPT